MASSGAGHRSERLPGPVIRSQGIECTFDAVKKIWPFWIIVFAIASADNLAVEHRL